MKIGDLVKYIRNEKVPGYDQTFPLKIEEIST